MREYGFTVRTSASEHWPCWKKEMPDPRTVLPGTPKRIGVAADHGGFELKEYISRMLREAHYEMVDFGDNSRSRTMIIPISLCRWPEP